MVIFTFPFYILSFGKHLVLDWFFPSKLSYRIESLRIWEHFMYVLHVISCGDNGISRDPLDVCFGDELASSVTLWTYA